MLVSVIVVTYNSQEFIIEALESIKRQTYELLELIITDDCSEDKTVEICNSWLRNNRSRFIRTELLTVKSNTGVTANCNRGLKISRGEWIKYCAGDDSLKPDCVAENINWISSHSNIKVLFSRLDVYEDVFLPDNHLDTIPRDPLNPNSILSESRPAESQYKMLLICDRIHFTPSVFIQRSALLSVGGFDERFRLLEDYPLWLNLTKKGYRLYFMDKTTVNYRQHLNAINNTGKDYVVNPNYFLHENFRRIYTYPELPFDIRWYQKFNWFVSQVFRLKLINRNQWANRLLFSLLTIYLNPFKYSIFVKGRLIRKYRNFEFYS